MLRTLLLAAAGLWFAGMCSEAATVQVWVNHTFAGERLQPESLRYGNGGNETLSVTRLSYLLSDFALRRTDGAWITLPDQPAWIDLEQRRTSFNLENVPAGTYDTLRFLIGLNKNVNHSDPAQYAPKHALNPNLNGLHWSWQGGYIFLACEGLFRTPATNELHGYALHLARDTNAISISIGCLLALSNSVSLEMQFDLARMLNGTQPVVFGRDGVATHSRDGDELAARTKANLAAAFSIAQAAPALKPAAPAEITKPLYLPAKFTPYRFRLDSRFPKPDLPADNPLIEERVALGKTLFHDASLSRDGTVSCASCHQHQAAMSDPRPVSAGVAGRTGTRNAMPLFNLAWKSRFFWDGRAESLRAQSLMPIQDHAEMDQSLPRLVAKLSSSDTGYPAMFLAAFGREEITAEKISLALEQFLLTLTSYTSKFDRALAGEETLSAQERRGLELFMTENDPRTGQLGADCFHCHGGALFTDNQFHNNGLGTDGASDWGRFRVTGQEVDRGKFATPSLRNVALTAPYMHDGRFATLEEVVKYYSEGVKREPGLDPNLAKHPVEGLRLSEADRQALVAFLKTLTDEQFIEAPATAYSHTQSPSLVLGFPSELRVTRPPSSFSFQPTE